MGISHGYNLHSMQVVKRGVVLLLNDIIEQQLQVDVYIKAVEFADNVMNTKQLNCLDNVDLRSHIQ